MKKILILSFSHIASDPRVMRQVRLLESSAELTVLGFGVAPETRAKFIQVPRQRTPLFRKLLWGLKLILGAHESYYWGVPHVGQALERVHNTDCDVLIANDLMSLPLALWVARGRPVIYDAHEYSPGEHENQLVWRLTLGRFNRAFCDKYLARAASMLTVCQGIADEYAKHYGVKPKVVHNAPAKQHFLPSSVDAGRVRMIHHGVASSARHLELMIEMMALLDARFTLDFMLMEAEPGYLARLKELASGNARISFVEPVPMPEICGRINCYDIGLYLLPPDNFNHRHALPNKFFEFVQARLAVAIGPSPEMAMLVKKHACGVVADSFAPESLANALLHLNEASLRRLKQASHAAAQVLCFEEEGRVIEDEVRRLAS